MVLWVNEKSGLAIVGVKSRLHLLAKAGSSDRGALGPPPGLIRPRKHPFPTKVRLAVLNEAPKCSL